LRLLYQLALAAQLLVAISQFALCIELLLAEGCDLGL
jgi:hypothetical protein